MNIRKHNLKVGAHAHLDVAFHILDVSFVHARSGFDHPTQHQDENAQVAQQHQAYGYIIGHDERHLGLRETQQAPAEEDKRTANEIVSYEKHKMLLGEQHRL